METTYYDVGDVVMLNSDLVAPIDLGVGVPMTVKESFMYEDEEGEEVGQGVTCVWFINGELFEEDFDICMVNIITYADDIVDMCEDAQK